MSAIAVDGRTKQLADDFVAFLETGEPRPGLFAPRVFCDFSLPHWRVQSGDRDGLVALRRAGHPEPGRVVRSRVDETASGFVIEIEERWSDTMGSWYCRELFRADVGDDGIEQLSVYCTGDWDEARQDAHRRQVHLLRP
jgi:hypothetical protein